ncbi:4,5-DOPA dioxygenase extradiol [Gluconacetobacter sacchari]|uniref:4,5-DOPA dioxygenase extradiol n=2 Tax=Gluconacetobacter sacchari TaxID=92759 RepID=A0A7W4IFK3_9PROT|nr:4,5-DOPA dioxygenase extradiol [Gluconacetobacter sacchari]MBB2161973.1 4,5-DOPA dioxygenase extradiol [Gluconacetobacter sacchari]GBQ18697.1 extradiol ring-cleavage dioxygenase class III protein subunit B [Gluconacetobacter sacchari DSM 12717]
MSMPVVFFGHGSPVIALQTNETTRTWHEIAQRITRDHGRPRAVLAISGHWLTRGVAVTAMAHPRTIHDFGPSLPRALFDIQYPAPGDPALAARIAELLGPEPVILDRGEWGLDHGTWSVMCKAWPDADMPVVQLSLDVRRAPRAHHDLARALRPLRDEGILIVGTGNIVHNLRLMDWARQDCAPHDWAASFEERIVQAVMTGDAAQVIAYEGLGDAARLSVPTPDHYWPLLYAMGAARETDRPVCAPRHIEHGSLSMTSITWWPA